MSEDSEKLLYLMEAVEEKDCFKTINTLKLLSSETKLGDVGIIQDLLKFNNINIIKTTTELIAELAKNETNRNICTNEDVIKDLVNLLECGEPDIVLNSVRALGNICYENEEACKIMDRIGPEKILVILRNDTDRKHIELTTKASGLILNLFNINDDFIRKCLKEGILQTVQDLLLKYSNEFDQNEPLITFLVCIINNLEHLLDEQDIPFTKDLCKILVDIFKKSKTPEISIPCLEIFHGQSEQEEIKILFAKEGVCELLIELVEKYKDHAKDEESRSILKSTCDFIVVILTGDECIKMLYNNSEGTVYKKMVTWLNSSDVDLLSTGILALGNFARSDAHCIQMTRLGISKKLISILKKYNTSTELEDVKLQHALLSTLKNLVIPGDNKARILNQGLIDVIYPMIKIDRDLVVFKLLGTFRMVIDGQESTALDLITRRDFIEKLVYWCYNSDHLGVRGEVPRLIAWLIKQCHSFKPLDLLLSIPDSIKCIIEMISSNHAVMQNESFYTLTLLFIGCTNQNENPDLNYENGPVALNNFTKILLDAEIGKHLAFVLNKYGDKMDRPTIENVITLMDHLCNTFEMIHHFRDVYLSTPINKLFDNRNICKVETLHRIETLISD